MLKTGIKGLKKITVTDSMTAKNMGSGELTVFATPSLIALAEETAWKSVAGHLEEGQGTVGTKMDLAHIAATPVGMSVRFETELVETDRRRLVFKIVVFDDTEKVAEGTHERFIVDNEKFQNKADSKNTSSYTFFGSENSECHAVSDEYPGISTPHDLYEALSHIWCADTCAPRMRDNWTPDNMTMGQCSITAFLAQDIFGGKVYGVPREGGTFHCYNVVGDCLFDLTSEQFENEVLVYDNEHEQSREVHFSKEEKKERYEKLRRLLSSSL